MSNSSKLCQEWAEVAVPVAMDEHGQWAVCQHVGEQGTSGGPEATNSRYNLGPDRVKRMLANLGERPGVNIGVGWLVGIVEFKTDGSDLQLRRLRQRLELAEKNAAEWQTRIDALREIIGDRGQR